MTTIKDTDLLLVNRDGVDYQATVSALPVGNVDLSEYAKLNDPDQHIIAKELSTARHDVSNVDGYGYYLQNSGRLSIQIGSGRNGSFTAYEIYKGDNKRLDITGQGTITGGQRLHLADGDSEKLVRFEINQNGNATFSGEVTAAKFIGDGSGLTNLPVPIQGIVPPIITYANADWSPGGKLSVETKGFCPGANTTSSCQWMRDYVDIPGATSCMGWTQTSTAGAYQLKILWTDRDTGQTGLAISNVIDVGGTPPSESGGGLPDFRDLPALS